MKLPRDVGGARLGKCLEALGYEFRRQVGSHARYRLTTSGSFITIPMHDSIPVGTLARIISDVESQTGRSRDEILRLL